MDVYTVSRLPQESTREYVYRFLKLNIMNFKLPPGIALSEKDIAAMLNVSRTPVREAFIQLSQEDLLEIMPQKGSYVSLINLESVAEAKFLRETLETAIMELACENFPAEELFELQSNLALQELCLQEKNYVKFFELDEAFHRIIAAGCKKSRTWQMMQQMYAHYNRVRILNTAGGYDLAPVLQQHREMLQAIREKNAELGIRTIKQHLNKVKIDIQDLIHDYGHYFRQPEEPVTEWNAFKTKK